MSGAGGRSSSSVGTARERKHARARAAPTSSSGASRSIAWQAQSNSIASTCARELERALRLERRAHAHADVVFLVRRRRESCRPTPDARASSARRSSAAAVTCAIISPDCRPPSRVRNAGRPLSAGLTSRSVRRSLIVASCARPMAQQIGGERHRRAVEVAARDDVAACRRTPSGCRWPRWPRSSTMRRAKPKASRAAPCTCAAQRMRIGVLHAAAVGVRRVDRAAGEQRARGWPPTRPGRRTAAAAWIRASNGWSEPLQRRRCSSRRRYRRRAPAARRPAAASASSAVGGLRAVDEREAFLGRERDWRRARPRASAVGAGHRPRAPSQTSPSPIRTSARCASGARSPLAPTDPRHGTTGCTPRLSSAMSAFERLEPDAREALRQHVRAQRHRRADGADRQRLADAGGMAAEQVDLQRAERLGAGSARRRRCRSRC